MPLALAAAALSSCTLPVGGAAVDARHTRNVVLGELHGTEGGPAMLARIACALAKRGERVLVALEQDAEDDAALHAAWALSDTGDFAVAVPRVLEWQGLDDGRASRATLAMLVALHRLKIGGAAIGLVAFNGTRDEAQRLRFKDLPGQGPHEAAQAENIRLAAAAERYDRVLVLVGNLHARKRTVARDGATFQPMAMRLAPLAKVTTLLLTSSAGAVWACELAPGYRESSIAELTSAAVSCGVHALRGDVPAGTAPGVRLTPLAESDEEWAYDGQLYTGPAIASPPVLP